MEKEFFAHEVPAGLRKDEVQFFVMNGQVQFIMDDKIHLFDEITIDIAIRLRNELDDDPRALEGMELLGITDPCEQLEKYVFCKFGGLELKPDLTPDESNPKYWDCGCRPCPADGMICKFPLVRNGHLTRHDMSVIREITSDIPNKIIADHLGNATDTVNKECLSIASKIGVHSQKGISYFAGLNHI